MIGIATDEMRGLPPENGASARKISPTASGVLDHWLRGSKQRIRLNWIPGISDGIARESQQEKAERRSICLFIANAATEIPLRSSAITSEFSTKVPPPGYADKTSVS